LRTANVRIAVVGRESEEGGGYCSGNVSEDCAAAAVVAAAETVADVGVASLIKAAVLVGGGTSIIAIAIASTEVVLAGMHHCKRQHGRQAPG
jgi:hypothetical protein